MIAKEGIQMLKLMYLRKVIAGYQPIVSDMGASNSRALAIIDRANADNYDRVMKNSRQYLTMLVDIGVTAKAELDALDALDLYDKI